MAYICYLTCPTIETNRAMSYPGKGATKQEARSNALYYNNQWPFVRIVAASRAPRWAQRQARDDRWHALNLKAIMGESLTPAEIRELEAYEPHVR